MDNRPAYRNRTVLAHAINNTYEVGFPDSMIEPSIIMIHHKNHDKDPEGVLADKCKADFVKLSGSNDLSKYGEGIYCSGNLQHNWKDLVPKYNHVNWDIKLFSRTVLSLRGDSLGSQRSTEGMYYGALTYHDAPLDVLSLTSIPMGNHVPWRLTGLFDEERCIENSAIALMDMYTYRKYSDPESYTYSFAHGLKLRNGTPYPSSDGEKFFEEKMMKCILKLPHLINNDHELLTLMRKAVYAYRDDVVWETPNSRLGENILFLAASALSDDTLAQFGLSKASFERQVPASCTGNSDKIIDDIRRGNRSQAYAFIRELGSFEFISGVYGRYTECGKDP
eukprot:GHVH01013883.1.p1 GENE.GHVH01013883.1~~GHVH01013883.1.p1  ORF type:complete len:336 (+),score=29.42 GHVH01013883.1:418-1425(+)